MLDLNQRFNGIERLYGSGSLTRLSEAHMVVLGIGGVGSWTCESLLRSGLGKITIVDLDDICITNTNRQIHTLESTYGQPKVRAMADRLKAINSDAEIVCIHDYIGKENLATILDSRVDIVIDAIDSLHSKVAVVAYCHKNAIPIITVGGAGGKRDPSMIMTGDLGDTCNDGLLRMLRKNLRQKHNFKTDTSYGIQAVYSRERAYFLQSDGSVSQRSNLPSGKPIDCNSGFGTASFVTGAFGFAASALAIQKLLETYV